MSRIPLLSAAALALTLSAPLAAQETPAPPPERILPPIRYSLPPGDSDQAPAQTPPPVVVTPPPVVAPTATPTPRATPSARPSAAATPTARPIATPTPAATATPEPEASERGAPAEASPAEPAATTTVPAEDDPAMATTPVAEPPAAPASADEGGNGWLIALVAMLVAAIGAFLWWRRGAGRRSRIDEADLTPVEAPVPDTRPAAATPPPAPTAEPRPVPVATPHPAPAAPPPAERDEPQFLSRPAGPPLPPRTPVPAGTITAFRDRPKPADTGFITAFRRPAPTLGIELQPIRAGTSEDTGFVEFQFAFLNQSDQAVSEMMVSAWMLTANADQDAQIAAYLNEPADPAQHTLYKLEPGEHREHRATMGEGFDQLHIVEAAGRRFFAPILVIDARYRGQGGGEGRSTAAFVVGRPNPATGKLLPIYVDRGARLVEGLAARPYPVPRSRAA
jgi:hypothetical protein